MIYLDQALEMLNQGKLPYSPANAAKVRGSVNKCAKLIGYNCPLSRIPSDPKLFEERWRFYKENKIAPEGFTFFGSFETWYSNVKSLMDHVSGERKKRDQLRKRIDDWTIVEEKVSDLIRPFKAGLGIRQEDLLSIKCLRNIAREHDCQPSRLTPAELQTWLKNLPSGQKKSVRKAAKLLDHLHSIEHDIPDEILPAKIGIIAPVTKRRVTPIWPAKIAQAIAEMKEDKRTGKLHLSECKYLKDRSELRDRYKTSCKETTIRSYGISIDWFFSCMVELGRLDLETDPDPVTFANYDDIFEAFETEVSGGFYWQKLARTTIRKNAKATFDFLSRYNPALKYEQKGFFQNRFFQNWETMTEDNQKFCRELIESDEKKLTFFSLARLCYEQAVPLVENYDSLPYNMKPQAVDWALGTALAAVLTFLPLRADTAIQLTCEGPDAHVFFPAKSNHIHFAIPPTIVKNNNKIVGKIKQRGQTDPRKILEWWLRSGRPLLMERLKSPDQTLLFGGAGYDRIKKAWRFSTASVGLYMCLQQVRHSIASILWNEPNFDLKAIATLLGDTETTVAKTYAFLDKKVQFERAQTGMDDVNAALEKRHTL